MNSPGATPFAFARQQPDAAPSRNAQEAQVLATAHMSILAANCGRFDWARGCFAEQVRVDYTSVWGGDPSVMAGDELLALWESALPGFDATLHRLSDLRCEVTQDRAKASARCEADHWLGGERWDLGGYFHWELERRGSLWLITSLSFALTQERGDRTLMARALTRAAMRHASKGGKA